jgi:ABC-type multidrug transport system ATPase subunit
MIQINNLTKIFKVKKKGHGVVGNLFFPRYEIFKAVDDVSFNINKGEILGLLGPNGAGKTTIINILSGLLQPTSGSALINGKTAEKQQEKIGLVLGPTMIYNRITGYDNLNYYARLYGVKDIDSRIDELCKQLSIKSWLDEYVEHYSTGMKVKLTLARALVHDPEILILDEPTLGLDVRISNEIRKKLPTLNKTILLTTHYIEEAKMLSDRIIILKKGKIAKTIEDPKNTNIKEVFLNEDK